MILKTVFTPSIALSFIHVHANAQGNKYLVSDYKQFCQNAGSKNTDKLKNFPDQQQQLQNEASHRVKHGSFLWAILVSEFQSRTESLKRFQLWEKIPKLAKAK